MEGSVGLVRALIVDDSAFMRRLLRDILEESGYITVIGIARDGVDAVEKNQRLQPDVITMDIEMPKMDGLEALVAIMETRPVPVVMFSSLTKAGAKETMEALASGAVDFVSKPGVAQDVTKGELKQEIINKVLTAAGVDVAKLVALRSPSSPASTALPVGMPTVTVSPLPPSVVPKPVSLPAKGSGLRIVALGTSTGGPRALQTVISALEPDARTAYFVVQHMPKGFTRTLAERLNNLSSLQVQEAEEALVAPDNVYVAPGGHHLTVLPTSLGLQIRLSQDPPVNGHRPAVDVLFQSLADQPGLCEVAVVLTGMGSDGAKGLAKLKAAGTFTIAEDASTAVIYGMPKAAVLMGAVDEVVPIHRIAEAIRLRLEGR